MLPQTVFADEHSVYMHVIDNDVDYLRIIDDSFSTFNDEPRYSELDDAVSYHELDGQQQGYLSHIEDDVVYQEANFNTTGDLDGPQPVADNELSYLGSIAGIGKTNNTFKHLHLH